MIKGLKILILLTALCSQETFGQEPIFEIDRSWTILKKQFKTRDDVINNLVTVISKSSKAEKQQLYELQFVASDFFRYIDTLSLRNTASISIADLKNYRIGKVLEETFLKLESNKKAGNKHEIMNLMILLEESENRIAVAKATYNKVCNHYKRVELLFENNKTDNIPKVKF